MSVHTLEFVQSEGVIFEVFPDAWIFFSRINLLWPLLCFRVEMRTRIPL